MKKKEISVIMPVYNYAYFLDRAFFSVYMQKIDCNIHFVACDDCSTDQSLDILHRLKNFENENFKISIFSNKENKGFIETVIFLLKNCSTSYVAYIDPDDYWIDPYKLKKQFDFLENNPDFSLVSTGYLIGEGRKLVPSADGSFWIAPLIEFNSVLYPISDGEIDKKLLQHSNLCYSSSRFFRNFTDMDLSYVKNKHFIDWAINFECSLRGRIGYLDYPSFVYEKKEDSMSAKAQDEITEKDLDEIKSIFNQKIS